MKFDFAKKLVLLAITGLTLSACQNNNNKSTSFASGGQRFSTSGVSGISASLTGRIFYSDYSQQAGFQQAAVGFLSTDVPPDYIGQVNPDGSGIRFGGRVALTSGSLRSFNGSGSSTITSNSSCAIQVLDQAALSGQVAALPALQFRQARGQVSGNQAQITFGDNFGSVTFQGVINTTTNTFEGYVSYENNVRYDGSLPGSAGHLGNFSIPLCNFFVCQ